MSHLSIFIVNGVLDCDSAYTDRLLISRPKIERILEECCDIKDTINTVKRELVMNILRYLVYKNADEINSTYLIQQISSMPTELIEDVVVVCSPNKDLLGLAVDLSFHLELQACIGPYAESCGEYESADFNDAHYQQILDKYRVARRCGLQKNVMKSFIRKLLNPWWGDGGLYRDDEWLMDTESIIDEDLARAMNMRDLDENYWNTHEAETESEAEDSDDDMETESETGDSDDDMDTEEEETY